MNAEKVKRELEEERRTIKKKLDRMTEGKLLVQKTRGRTRCYKVTYDVEKVDGKSKSKRVRKYIKRSNRRLIFTLAKKLILQTRLKSIEREIKALNAYLKIHRPLDEALTKLLEKGGPTSEILKEFLDEERKKLLEWQNADYERLESHPEELKYKSLAGTWHRSKGEVVIANALYLHGIPFRCECRMVMHNGRVSYPDFVIMHPITHEIYIWEHFGMMDIESYLHHAMDKISAYGKSGYIINDKLIVTMESDEMHINSEEIDEIIEKYFAC